MPTIRRSQAEHSPVAGEKRGPRTPTSVEKAAQEKRVASVLVVEPVARRASEARQPGFTRLRLALKERQRRRLATHRTMLWPRLSSCWALEKRHAVVSRLPLRRLYCLHCLQIRRLQI